MAFALAGPFVEMDPVLAPPVRGMAVGDDDVGGLDEGPFQGGVALFNHPTLVGPASAGAELGDEHALAGEVLGGLADKLL